MKLRTLLLATVVASSTIFIAGWAGGCGSDLHKAATAADVIASSLQTAESINHDAAASGAESTQERDLIGGYLSDAAKANDAFIATINAAETSGSTSVPQSAIDAFSALVTQVNTLNSNGILRLKSTSAQAQYKVVITAIQTELAVLDCPIICTGWIVSVAQLPVKIDSRSRGCAKVGSVLGFPLLHAPCCL